MWHNMESQPRVPSILPAVITMSIMVALIVVIYFVDQRTNFLSELIGRFVQL